MAGPRERSRRKHGALTQLAALVSGRRLEAGLTQRELADLADVGLSSVRSLEAGDESMTLAVVLRILDALAVNLYASAGPVAGGAALLRLPDELR